MAIDKGGASEWFRGIGMKWSRVKQKSYQHDEERYAFTFAQFEEEEDSNGLVVI